MSTTRNIFELLAEDASHSETKPKVKEAPKPQKPKQEKPKAPPSSAPQASAPAGGRDRPPRAEGERGGRGGGGGGRGRGDRVPRGEGGEFVRTDRPPRGEGSERGYGGRGGARGGGDRGGRRTREVGTADQVEPSARGGRADYRGGADGGDRPPRRERPPREPRPSDGDAPEGEEVAGRGRGGGGGRGRGARGGGRGRGGEAHHGVDRTQEGEAANVTTTTTTEDADGFTPSPAPAHRRRERPTAREPHDDKVPPPRVVEQPLPAALSGLSGGPAPSDLPSVGGKPLNRKERRNYEATARKEQVTEDKGFFLPKRRAFDRKSGTGRAPNDNKKQGAGKGNWGTVLDEVEEAEAIEAAGTAQTEEDATIEATEAAEDAAAEEGAVEEAAVEEAVTAEEEAVEPEKQPLTLEEYQKLQAEQVVNLALPPPRAASEGDYSKYVPLERRVPNDDDKIRTISSPAPEKSPSNKKEKKDTRVPLNEVIQVVPQRSEQRSDRGDGGERGGRGGGRGGRGAGRGGASRGGDRRDGRQEGRQERDRQAPASSPKLNLDDKSNFPSLASPKV